MDYDTTDFELRRAGERVRHNTASLQQTPFSLAAALQLDGAVPERALISLTGTAVTIMTAVKGMEMT